MLIIEPVLPEDAKAYGGYSHGVGMISAVLKASGFGVNVLRWSPDLDPRRTGDSLSTFLAGEPNPVAGIHLCTWAYRYLGSLVATIRLCSPAAKIIVGGPHAMGDPLGLLEEFDIDAVCLGEAESVLPRLIASLDGGEWDHNTPGFLFRDGNGVKTNTPAPAITDLDSLPFPDRSFHDLGGYLKTRAGRIMGAEFVTSRGCPHRCGYCINATLKDRGLDQGVRYRSPANVIREILLVRDRFPSLETIGFHDDMFGLDPDWLHEFAELYLREIGLKFWINSRPETMTPERAALLAEMGCVRVHIGVESGSVRIRRELMNRFVDDGDIIAGFEAARSAGIKTLSFSIIGLPFETEEELRLTIELNRSIRPARLQVSVFQPFPGTPMEKSLRGRGLMDNNTYHRVHNFFVLENNWFNPVMDPERGRYYLDNFVKLVYGP